MKWFPDERRSAKRAVIPVFIPDFRRGQMLTDRDHQVDDVRGQTSASAAAILPVLPNRAAIRNAIVDRLDTFSTIAIRWMGAQADIRLHRRHPARSAEPRRHPAT